MGKGIAYDTNFSILTLRKNSSHLFTIKRLAEIKK